MDSKRVDARADIYSLGVVLHEMLTGETPAPFFIDGKVPVKQIRPSVPTSLERVVEKCTELDPRQRYQTMDELIESVNLDLVNRCALIDFYEATGGDNWRWKNNWLTDAPLDNWHGVTANYDGAVLRLHIPANDLEGEIPAGISHLTELNYLNLAHNRLSGSIPSELGGLIKLERLNLIFNRLSGSIPSELGNLTKLERLDLGGNCLSGSMPPELGNLTRLRGLYPRR